jgi:hypothetical protein
MGRDGIQHAGVADRLLLGYMGASISKEASQAINGTVPWLESHSSDSMLSRGG